MSRAGLLAGMRAQRDALKTEVGLLAEERDQARETTRCYRNGSKKIQEENEALKAEVKGLRKHTLHTNGLLLLAAMHKEDVDGEHYLDAETKEECRMASVAGQDMIKLDAEELPDA